MNVTLPANVWVNLYTATGISVGTKIKVFNLGSTTVRLASTANTPTPADDHFTLRATNLSVENDTTDLGAWALSTGSGGVNVTSL